jgi:hypothetical protein
VPGYPENDILAAVSGEGEEIGINYVMLAYL